MVRNRSTTGDHNGLITHGRYSQLVYSAMSVLEMPRFLYRMTDSVIATTYGIPCAKYSVGTHDHGLRVIPSASVIRWKFVLPAAALLAAVVAFFVLFFDPLAERALESAASKVNGAAAYKVEGKPGLFTKQGLMELVGVYG